MKIEDPAIIAALQKAAYALNLSPSQIIAGLLSGFVEQMQEAPAQYLCEFSTCFPHQTESAAEIAAERLSEFVASESLEGRTQFTVACKVVEHESGFAVHVDQLHPNNGLWLAADGSGPLPKGDEDQADWWK